MLSAFCPLKNVYIRVLSVLSACGSFCFFSISKHLGLYNTYYIMSVMSPWSRSPRADVSLAWPRSVVFWVLSTFTLSRLVSSLRSVELKSCFNYFHLKSSCFKSSFSWIEVLFFLLSLSFYTYFRASVKFVDNFCLLSIEFTPADDSLSWVLCNT